MCNSFDSKARIAEKKQVRSFSLIQWVQLDRYLVKHHFHDATKQFDWECVRRDGATAVRDANDGIVDGEEHSPLLLGLNPFLQIGFEFDDRRMVVFVVWLYVVGQFSVYRFQLVRWRRLNETP